MDIVYCLRIENGLSNWLDILDKEMLFVNTHKDKTLWNCLVFQ